MYYILHLTVVRLAVMLHYARPDLAGFPSWKAEENS